MKLKWYLNIGIGAGIGIITSIILIFFSTNPYIPAGYEGYVYEEPRIFGKGGFQGIIIGPGNFGISLLNNKVFFVDIRPNTYKETFKILAKDDLNVALNIEAVLKIRTNNSDKVIQDYGGNKWYKRFIQEPFRSFVRNAAQKYTSRDLKFQREKIEQDIEDNFKNYIKNSPFIIVKLVVGNIDYPEMVTKAVENKLAALQLLEEKETQKEIAKKDAEIKIEEANGIAQAQQIINSTLTTNYLQHEAIQAQLHMANSPNHTTVYIPSGHNGIPLMKMIK